MVQPYLRENGVDDQAWQDRIMAIPAAIRYSRIRVDATGGLIRHGGEHGYKGGVCLASLILAAAGWSATRLFFTPPLQHLRRPAAIGRDGSGLTTSRPAGMPGIGIPSLGFLGYARGRRGREP